MADSPCSLATQCLALPPSEREAWIINHVPKNLREWVRGHVEGHDATVKLMADYVLAGKNKEQRQQRLALVSDGIREEVRALVTERYQQRKAK